MDQDTWFGRQMWVLGSTSVPHPHSSFASSLCRHDLETLSEFGRQLVCGHSVDDAIAHVDRIKDALQRDLCFSKAQCCANDLERRGLAHR